MTTRRWLGAFHGFENALRRLSKFEVRRVEKALLLLFIEQVFGRYKLENLDAIAKGPAMRDHDLPQLCLSFRQRDVEALLSNPRSFEHEL